MLFSFMSRIINSKSLSAESNDFMTVKKMANQVVFWQAHFCKIHLKMLSVRLITFLKAKSISMSFQHGRTHNATKITIKGFNKNMIISWP